MERTQNGFYIAIGQQGSGKTALITSLAVNEYNLTNRLILSNYNIKLPHIKIDLISIINLIKYEDSILIKTIAYNKITQEVFINQSLQEIINSSKDYVTENEITIINLYIDYFNITGKHAESNSDYLNNSIILLDEIHVYFDAYDFLKKENRIISAFASQLRKRNTLLLATTQYLLAVSIRLRKQIKIVFDIRKIGSTFISNVARVDGYYFDVIKEIELDLKSYFPYYDTHEIIRP